MSNIALTDRYQFPLYPDRAAYKAASGVDAPPFNPAYPIKTWFDPAGGGNYQTVGGSVISPALVPMVMPTAEAQTVNLPGKAVFPAYEIAPTPATQQLTVAGHIFPATPIDPSTLSTLDQANALAAISGATVVNPDNPPNQFFVVSWNGETRRRFKLQFGGQANLTAFVGQILQSQFAKRQDGSGGVNSPGHWDTTQFATGMVWIPDAVPDGAGVTAHVPIPVKLQDGETLVGVMVNVGVWVTMVQSAGAAPSSGGTGGTGGGFTDDDRAKLTAIYKAIAGA